VAASSLRAYLFGALNLHRGEETLTLPASAAARSLLAFLLFHRQQLHPRSVLAGIFWPEMGESRARRALSQALWHLRTSLPEIIQADQQTIGITSEAQLWIDVENFQALVRPHLVNPLGIISAGDQPLEASEHLYQAVELYRGDLLEGIYDDWVLLERERLRDWYLRALEALVGLEKSAGRYNRALEFALTLTRADPLQEPLHREVMRLYFALDRPNEAIKQFDLCRQILSEELGIEPEMETLTLTREIAGRSQTADAPYLPEVSIAPSPLVGDITQPGQLVLVGREQERGELVICLEALFNDVGGVVLVEGEAGVGKTRLLEEVARDAEWRAIQVGWGFCREMAGSRPFAPLAEALQSGLSRLRLNQLVQLLEPIWLQVMGALLPDIRSQLSEPGQPPPLPPAQEHERLVAAFTQMLAAWGQITPLMILLEDLHWADQDSLEVLIDLAPRLQNRRVLLVGTYRGEEARSTPKVWAKIRALDRAGLCNRLVLSRLSQFASGELVRRSLCLVSPAPLFEERLYRETGGNPLFILETLRALHGEGLLVQDEGGKWHTPWDETTTDYGELPLPPAVERIIARRLDRLQSPYKEILNLAAVLGERFSFNLLQKVSNLEARLLLTSIHTLVQQRYIRETEQDYQFSHAKIRQVMYDGVASEERCRLHCRVAETLEGDTPDQVEALAYHYTQGQSWDKALHFNRLAGDQALAVYANTDAAAFFTQALEAWGHLPEPGDLTEVFELRLARVLTYARSAERDKQAGDLVALDALLQNLDLATPTRRAKVALLWSKYWESLSDYPAALAAVQKAVENAMEAYDPQLEYQARTQWGRLHRHLGQLDQARGQLERAAALAQESGDPLAQAESLNDLSVIIFDQGDFDTALDHAQRALEVCTSTGDQVRLASIYSNIGGIYHYLADYPAALQYRGRALEMHRAVGDRRFEAADTYNLATVHFDDGNPETARQLLEQVCNLTRDMGDRRVEGYGWVFLGLVLEETGELDKAHEAYTTGLTLRREVGLPALEIDAIAGLARVASAQGDHQRAVAHADVVLGWLEEEGVDGVGDPLLAYKGAYQALLAAGEIERGQAALGKAYQLMMSFASSIADQERRRAYLHDIEPSKTIWRDYQAMRSQRVQVRLPRADAPLGRPLQEDEWVQVDWSVEAPEDEGVPGKVPCRRHRLLRLLDQAEAQGAAPTLDDLADALSVSPSTVKRDLAELRKQGHSVQTRGRR
jgi:predicted ATPase/DNA-binding SARP family transcriptional activator